MSNSVNLTDQQWDLLRLLVDNHASKGGAEFHFACSFGGCGITYSGGKAVPGVYDQTDLLQLRSERLVTLVRLAQNLHRGKPTQLGISTAQADPAGAQRNTPTDEGSPSKFPPLPDVDIEKIKAEAQENIERARNILRLGEQAEAKLSDSPPCDRSEIEAERDRFLTKATDRIKFTSGNLFDAFAEECWKVIRPDSESFSKLLPEICVEVAKVVFGPDLDHLVADTLTARTTKWAQRTAREGAVRNSSGWAVLRAQFAALARQENESFGRVADTDLLHAFVNYETGLVEVGQWSLGGSTESIRTDFMLYATRAAVALGAPNGVDLTDYWLHRLFSDLLENRSKHLRCAKEGEGGMIMTLLDASAIYCARLERTALANDHQQKPTIGDNRQRFPAPATPETESIEGSRNGGIRLFMNRIPNVDRYPPDFNDAERDRIKAAELRAAGVIALNLKSVRSMAEAETVLLRDWVLPIFVAFSHLALKRAKEGAWSIHKTDAESHQFLKALAASAGMNSPDAWMAGGGLIIRAEIWRELEDSQEWNRHREKLLELVDAPDHAAVIPEAQRNQQPDGSEAAVTSAEPNPFPEGHRSHQVWERLPRGIREALSRLSWAPGAAAGTSLSLEDCVQQLADQLDCKGSGGDVPVDNIAGGDPSEDDEGDANAPSSLTEPPERMRRRQKTAADLNAVYHRCRGRDLLAAGRQEELLHDAREYAAMSLTAAVEELRLPSKTTEADVEAACEKIRDLIVLDALTNYVPQHTCISDFHLGARDFKAALWIEGDYSLEDRAREAIQERIAPRPVSEKSGAAVSDPQLSLEQSAGKNGRESNITMSADQPVKSPIDSAAASRRAAVDAYIEEVFMATGRRITRTEIWKKAGDKSRTEFERWESLWYEKKHRKPNGAANRRFTQILTNKPHIK